MTDADNGQMMKMNMNTKDHNTDHLTTHRTGIMTKKDEKIT